MLGTFLTFISLQAEHYLDDKFIEIRFLNTQTFLAGGLWWADGAQRGLGAMGDTSLGQTRPWEKGMTYFCSISPKLTSPAVACGQKHCRFVFVVLQPGSCFSHRLTDQKKKNPKHPAFSICVKNTV